jgi:hypothetical protein
MIMKAQVAMETIVYAGVLMLALGVAAYTAVQRETTILSERISLDARSVAEGVADEINIASGVGDGYSHVFTIPEHLAGTVNYTVEVLNNERKVYVFRGNSSYAAPVLASNISGSIRRGVNYIRNEDGVVMIE